MKTLLLGGVVAAFFLSMTLSASADPSVSALRKDVADAQKQVDRAQAELNEAKKSGASSDDIDSDRSRLTKAQNRLAHAKDQLQETERKNNNGDSSQAIQPENRTSNGSNFSIRSQRDSENHPPLPSSQ